MCPLDIFGNKSTDGTYGSKYIGFQSLALIQGQIYTPAQPGRLNIHVHPTDYDNQWSQDRKNVAERWMEFWWSRGRIYLPKKKKHV